MPDGHPRETVETVLDGFRSVVPPTWTVTHARGAEIETLVPDPEGPLFPDGQPRPPVSVAAPTDPDQVAEAVATARAADLAVVVLGDTIALTGEGCSTATLDLQGGQVALLDALVDALDGTGTPVVVVLLHSKPNVLPPSALRAAAVIEAFSPGMRGGRAVAELVLGHIEPMGRLPISVPRHVGQQPTYYNQVRGQHGHRYADLTQEPQFVFGEGMTYTTVEWSDLTLEASDLSPDDVVTAEVTLTNTGERTAYEVVQAYVTDVVSSVTWLPRSSKLSAAWWCRRVSRSRRASRSRPRPAPSSTPRVGASSSRASSSCASG
jgi:beta-glucosidase